MTRYTLSRRHLLALLAAAPLAGCATAPATGPQRGSSRQVASLNAAIAGLAPGVDPAEAARAAAAAYEETHTLALAYRITDPPLIHNTKVNMGLRPRGLCWHWADDMEKRLASEGFRTLDLHRAIANATNPFRIDHSTVIVSARGAAMEDGIVLDPWRKGGILTWTPVRTDPDYDWVERSRVLAWKATQGAF